MRKLSKEQIRNKLEERCSDSPYSFDFDNILSSFITVRSKIPIICNVHGEFLTTYTDFVTSKYGCGKCCRTFPYYKDFSKLKEKLLDRCRNTQYSFDFEEICKIFTNNKIKIPIACEKHGKFFILIGDFFANVDCSKCVGNSSMSKNKEMFFEILQKRCENTLYTFDIEKILKVYKNYKTRFPINCKIHGEFLTTLNLFIYQKCGCTFCSNTRGEQSINKILKNLQVYFETQKTFDGCKDKNRLRFDFYLPFYNICFEFNGSQHYEFNKFLQRTEQKFFEQQKRDKIKKEFCEQNGIELIVIKYDQFQTEEEISTYIKQILERKYNQ